MARKQKFSNDGFAIRQIMSDARTGNGERREQIHHAQLAREARNAEARLANLPAHVCTDACDPTNPWSSCPLPMVGRVA